MTKVIGLILKGDSYNRKTLFVNNYLWVTEGEMDMILGRQDENPNHVYWVDNRMFSVRDISVAQPFEYESLPSLGITVPEYLKQKISQTKLLE